ncbi:MAG TPA: hypothetical protein VLA11_08020, partial [Woeseiaceae bacterium]|nr:hypothetical protein [Woeseiaceae bacterium]
GASVDSAAGGFWSEHPTISMIIAALVLVILMIIFVTRSGSLHRRTVDDRRQSASLAGIE